MPGPNVIFFDVNETLLDMSDVQTSVAQRLGGRSELVPLWFSTMLHHSLVDTVTGRYHDFSEIGVNALLMVARTNDIPLSEEDAFNAIVPPMQALPPHKDVIEALQTLRASGFTLISLTNSPREGMKAQLKNAGLTRLLDDQLSIEDIGIYKPDLRAYEWALDKAGAAAGEAMLVAAHGWDVAGARAAGLQAAFVSRSGKTLYPLAIEPDHVVRDLGELAALLTSGQ
jgi:2-haloacid dehalogenase